MCKIKTSETHPIRVDIVSLDNVPGKIGMTFCPGKKLKNAYSGGDWGRDLSLDLTDIVACGTSVLVTLIEDHEFEKMEVTALPEIVKGMGLTWYHLPIIDGDTPDQAFERAWQQAGTELRQYLRQGETVVLHCKGGLGRTGMIAARLIVELGGDPIEAIQKVRHARQGAIETKAQEEHVLMQLIL